MRELAGSDFAALGQGVPAQQILHAVGGYAQGWRPGATGIDESLAFGDGARDAAGARDDRDVGEAVAIEIVETDRFDDALFGDGKGIHIVRAHLVPNR